MEAVEAMEKNGKKSFLEMPLAQRARHLKMGFGPSISVFGPIFGPNLPSTCLMESS